MPLHITTVFMRSNFSFPPNIQVKTFICCHSMANVVELKVNLHCEECVKKILKAIKKIEDIETYNVDTQLGKVTVTGNVTTEEVIRVLQKIRKTASPWGGDENVSLN